MKNHAASVTLMTRTTGATLLSGRRVEPAQRKCQRGAVRCSGTIGRVASPSVTAFNRARRQLLTRSLVGVG